MSRGTREKPRPELSNAPAERLCVTCRRRYTNAASHVLTDLHLEAMAKQTVREWFALSPLDPVSVGVGKQIARLEWFYADHGAWFDAMALADTPESFAMNRRIAWIWIVAQGHPDFERRMGYPRKLIELEYGMEKKGAA